MLDLNTFPYYDDFESLKGYHKILFHPAKPVQARELTQIQSILQAQIKRHGDHVFKNGTLVIPGHVFYDDTVKFLKLEVNYNDVNIETYISDLVGTTIAGDTNGITATVVHYDVSTDTDQPTIYIKYLSASGAIQEFQSGETLTSVDIPGLVFKIAPLTTYTGAASICTIGEGVYYVNGYFVQVLKQSVTVSKYTNTASAVVGLDYIESIVTENEDYTLNDNAFGFTNYNAPGAHRLKISLTLSKKDYEYTSADTAEIKFIDLLKINNGKIEYLKNETKYAEIEKWLARRTYEESGDYVVSPFSFNAAEYRKNDRGIWLPNIPVLIGDLVSNGDITYIAMNQGYTGSAAPVHTYGIVSDGVIYWNQVPNKRLFDNKGTTPITSELIDEHIIAESKMAIQTSPGKAYIKGFEIEFNLATTAVVSKARQTRQLSQAQLYTPAGAYIVVKDIIGVPSITANLTKVDILDVTSAIIGTARVRSLEYLSGTPGIDSTYRLFLFNIKLNTKNNFARDAYSFNSTSFSANIVSKVIPLSGSGTSAATTITGVGTYFDFELSVGDRIVASGVSAKVVTISSPTTITTSVDITASASTLYREIAELVILGDYVRKLPSKAINTLRDINGDIDMQYVVSKSYQFTTVGTTYNIILTNGETFLHTGHIIISGSTGLPVNATYSLDTPATTLTISGLLAATDYKGIILVKRTGAFAKEKTKSLAVGALTLTNATSQKYDSKNISLNEADCLRIIKITESGDPTDKASYVEAGESDITNKYVFDNGQRAEYYDVGRVRTNRTTTRPIRIIFEYFVHSDGDYFSVDSYSSIPTALLNAVKIGDVDYYLPDCLDFRSRISDNGTEFNVVTGASVSDPLSSESTMSTSYSYFLSRTDSLGISNSGEMTYILGGDMVDGMPLVTISVAAKTNVPSTDVSFSNEQILNYTMRAVKDLDSRLSNVETEVLLSAAEKSTVNLSIKDSFGLERDKNGFLVDNFTGLEVSDISNPDLSTAIDPENRECRALAILDGVTLMEPTGITATARKASNYQLTGSLITLPYEEVNMLNQSMASKAEIVQAYSTLDFTGKLDVLPAADNYVIHRFSVVNDPTVRLAPVTNNINKTTRAYITLSGRMADASSYFRKINNRKHGRTYNTRTDVGGVTRYRKRWRRNDR